MLPYDVLCCLILSYVLNQLWATRVLFCTMMLYGFVCSLSLSCVALCCLMVFDVIKHLLVTRVWFVLSCIMLFSVVSDKKTPT